MDDLDALVRVELQLNVGANDGRRAIGQVQRDRLQNRQRGLAAAYSHASKVPPTAPRANTHEKPTLFRRKISKNQLA